VDETAVYNCTGNPHPRDIEWVVQSMMADEFGTSYNRMFYRLRRRAGLPGRELIVTVITSLKIDQGLALQDLIAGAYEFLETVELPKQSRIYLLDHLGSCE
jgi:replication factor C subunit 3/5